MEIISSLPSVFTPLNSSWVPHSDRFITVGSFKDGTGVISLRQVDKDLNCISLRDIEHKSGFRCSSFGIAPDCLRYLTTGQYDGSVSLWDISHCNIPVWSCKHGDSLINCVTTNPSGSAPEVISCSRDGSIFIWDTRLDGLPVISILSENKQASDCWNSKYDPIKNDCIFAGYKNGDICGYDLRQNGCFWKHSLSDGICSIDINKNHNTLLASSIKGKYYIFRMQDIQDLHVPLVASLSSKIHSSHSTIWSAAYSPFSNDYMLTTNNGNLSLYNQLTPNDDWDQVQVQNKNELRVSDCGIISFEWNKSIEGLFIFSCIDNTTSIGMLT